MAKTLYEYYTGKGQALPGVSERAKTYESLGLGKANEYKGDANQNTALLGKLSSPTDSGSSYVSEVKSQLTGTEDTSKDPYGTAKIKTDLETNTKGRDEAFQQLKDISTTTFNEEYASRGLAEKKAKLATIDADIATEKQKRDDAIAKVRGNSGLSAAQMTGDIKKLADYQNDVINNKIAERNSVAGEYNTALSEIDKVVENKVKDKTLDYNYYSGLVSNANTQLGDYTKAMREELQDQTKNEQFDRQLAQALQIAQINASKSGSSGAKLQLKTDPFTGEALYWFDPDTGEITYINGGGNDTTGNDVNPVEEIRNQLQNPPAAKPASTTKWYNPLTWF